MIRCAVGVAVINGVCINGAVVMEVQGSGSSVVRERGAARVWVGRGCTLLY